MTSLCECGCGQPTLPSTRHRPDRGLVKGQHQRFLRGHSSAPTVFTGSDHPGWLGDDAGYSAIHKWVARNLVKTGTCARCGQSHHRTHWANRDHQYRRDASDYAELCPTCHKRYDLGVCGWAAYR